MIEPHAVMVELFHTVIAHRTVFGSRWLMDLAGRAHIIFLVHDPVVFIQLSCSLRLLIVFYDTWIDGARFVKAVVTGEHYPCTSPPVPSGYVGRGAIPEVGRGHINVVATDG